MSIHALMGQQGEDIIYTQPYRRMLETLMAWLRTHPTTTTRPIDPYITLKYKGDLYGFLIAVGIDPSLHWLIMRMNDMQSPTDFDERFKFLLVPYDNTVEEIKNSYRTVTKKIS